MDGLKAPSNKGQTKDKKKITKSKKEPMPNKNSALTSLMSIVVTALVVGGAIYAWQDRVKDSSLAEIEKDAKSVREGYERSLKTLQSERKKIEEEAETLKTQNEELKETVNLIEGAVKTYENEEIGISLTYPAILGDLIYEKMPGESGDKFVAEFTNNPSLYMAGVTGDYISTEDEVATTTDFDNFISYEESGDNYVYRVAYNGEVVEYDLNPAEVIGFNGGEALLVDRNSFVADENQVPVGIGQNVGVLLNTNNQEGFSGVAFLNSDFGKLSLEGFKDLIRNIEIN